MDPVIQEKCSKLACAICQKGMATPAIFFLEMYKPFVGLFSCCAVVGEPLLRIFIGSELTQSAIQFLENRENVEEIICQIEEIEKKKKVIKDRAIER